jgi:hypothetical protein
VGSEMEAALSGAREQLVEAQEQVCSVELDSLSKQQLQDEIVDMKKRLEAREQEHNENQMLRALVQVSCLIKRN